MSNTAVPAGSNHHLVDTPGGVELRRNDGSFVATIKDGSLMGDAYHLAREDDKAMQAAATRLSFDVRYETALYREDTVEPVIGRRAVYPPICAYCLRPRTPLGPHNCTTPKGEIR